MRSRDKSSQTESPATNWRRLEALFQRAVELTPGERRTFLQAQSNLDPALLAQLEALLEADASGNTNCVGSVIRASLTESCRDARTLTIPNYEILGFIAEGAVGDVFLAYQLHPIKRLVAVKVLKLGVDSEKILARFEAERQTLASLDHVGIARVYDAGITTLGRPYFAMQYVAGEPIHRFCQNNNRPLKQRVSLLLQACDAIEHAHRHGVIHRDLKSVHILVQMREGTTRTVVIDFGIAKTRANAGSQLTADGEPLGTLLYASPEQLGLVKGGVDARSDVYALGVVLFEVLTGELPFVPGRGTTTRERIYERKTASLPPRPSRLLTQYLQNVGKNAPTQRWMKELVRGCRHELDWVCRRALEPEPSHRYQSVRELAQDLQRFLDGRAVEARPPSIVYLTRKLARRHVPAAAAFLIALLGVAAALVGLSVGIVEAHKEARRAEDAQRGLAQALDTYRATTQFWRHLLVESSGYPVGLAAGDRTLSQILDDLPEAIATHLAEREDVAANVKVTAGLIFSQLGRHDDAASVLAEGLSKLEDRTGYDLPFMRIQLARELQALGRFSEAGALIDELQDAVCGTNLESSINCCTVMSQKGVMLKQMGLLRRAVGTHRQALKVCLGIYGPGHWELAAVRQNLAVALVAVREYKEAESEYRQALAIAEQLLNPRDPRRLDIMSNLGSCLVFLGQYQAAEGLLKDALRLREGILGSNHPTVAWSLSGLAELYLRRGEYHEALQSAQAGLQILERLLASDHHEVSLLKIKVGRALSGLGHDTEAEDVMRDAYERLFERFPTHTHPYVRTAMWELHNFYESRGREKEAAVYWKLLGFGEEARSKPTQ